MPDGLDANAIADQDGWTVHNSVGDHSFVGTDVVVERLEDGDRVERDGTIAAIWEFPGRPSLRAARRRRAARGRRGPEHGRGSSQLRLTSVRRAVVRAHGTPHRYNPAVSRRTVNTTGQLTPAAIWRESTRRHGTLPLFSRGQYKRSPVGETRLRPGRSPRRAARGQHAMTLRRFINRVETNRLSTDRCSATSAGSSPVTVEEERVEESPPSRARPSRTTRTATRERDTPLFTMVSDSVGAFNTLHYCYHSEERESDTPLSRATSHVVAPASRVERGGATPHV